MALTKQDLQEISTLLDPLQNDMQDMSKRLASLEMHIENDTDRNIQRLAESQLNIINELDDAMNTHITDLIFEIEISSLKSRVTRLEEKRT